MWIFPLTREGTWFGKFHSELYFVLKHSSGSLMVERSVEIGIEFKPLSRGPKSYSLPSVTKKLDGAERIRKRSRRYTFWGWMELGMEILNSFVYASNSFQIHILGRAVQAWCRLSNMFWLQAFSDSWTKNDILERNLLCRKPLSLILPIDQTDCDRNLIHHKKSGECAELNGSKTFSYSLSFLRLTSFSILLYPQQWFLVRDSTYEQWSRKPHHCSRQIDLL